MIACISIRQALKLQSWRKSIQEIVQMLFFKVSVSLGSENFKFKISFLNRMESVLSTKSRVSLLLEIYGNEIQKKVLHVAFLSL